MNPTEYPWVATRIPPTGAVRGADRLPTSLAEAVDGLCRRRRIAEREAITELPADSLSDLQWRWRPLLDAGLGLDGTNRGRLDELSPHEPDEASRRVIAAWWRELSPERNRP